MEELRALPFREAIAFFRQKGYAHPLQRFHHLDHWREEHARNFVVAKAMQDDVLEAIRAEVDRALAEGRTLKQFQKDLMPTLVKKGWWGQQEMEDPVTGEMTLAQLGSMRRLEVIFDTNIRTAHAAGRWAALQRTKRMFPYLQYLQVDRPTKRHSHEAYAGKVWRVDDPIWKRIFPPNGFFCSCYTRSMTEKEFERSGLPLSTIDDLVERPYVNKRSGEVTQVPVGVHPGFDSNPGASWLDLSAKVDAVMPEADEGVKASLRGVAQNLRGRYAYDDRRVAVVTDKAGTPVKAVFAPDETPAASFGPDLPVPEGGEIVTLQLAETPLPYDELELLANTEARAITSIAPGGGSIARATPGPALRAMIGVDPDNVPVLAAFYDRQDAYAAEIALLPPADADAILRHALLLLLARAQAITYSLSASDRLAQLFDAYQDLIARLLGSDVG
jgi:SPP1 gp7 family putative phage head morphogenesis protein